MDCGSSHTQNIRGPIAADGDGPGPVAARAPAPRLTLAIMLPKTRSGNDELSRGRALFRYGLRKRYQVVANSEY
jgi:hypothetical protein